MSARIAGHIGPVGNCLPAPQAEGAPLPAAATSWVRERFPGLPPQVADALAHAFEAGFNAGGDRAVQLLTSELRAQGLAELADQVAQRWSS